LKTKKLIDFANVITGFPFKGEKYSNQGIRVVRGENVTEGALRWDTIKCWEDDFDQIQIYSLNSDDIVIGMDGSKVGKNIARIKKSDLPLLLAQRISCIRAKNQNNQGFIYYNLYNPRFIEYVFKTQTGSSVPHISKKQIEDFEIPEIDEISQSQIAKVLSDLDAKIELNNKINTELEAMAKLIYDYWFVQFDFPNEDGLPYKSSGGNMVWNEELKREIPEGWEVKELSKVLSIKYGKDHKKLNNGIIPVYGSGGVMRYVDEYLYNDETILIPRKGSIGNLFYVNEPFWSVDTMFYTKASKKGSVLYYFYQLSKLNLLTLNVGTAVPSLTVEILNKIKLLAPEPIILEKFNSIIFRNKEKSLSIIKENQKLSELRDWLLPMLMNGQVKVK
jgi:type I restriction enzyme S subunit